MPVDVDLGDSVHMYLRCLNIMGILSLYGLTQIGVQKAWKGHFV